MGGKSILTCHPRQAVARSALACLFAGAFVLTSALAAAQEAAHQPDTKGQEDQSILSSIARWFDEQAANINSSLKDARKKFENFGHEASIAARTTADTAKDAADAVARIPNARVFSGHVKCRIAPNGAPDCIAAANTVCKAKGFASGKSVDMTTAETCPPKVYMSGRSSGPGCRTETFVSRVLCQ
jgi:hypothetical protein